MYRLLIKNVFSCSLRARWADRLCRPPGHCVLLPAGPVGAQQDPLVPLKDEQQPSDVPPLRGASTPLGGQTDAASRRVGAAEGGAGRLGLLPGPPQLRPQPGTEAGAVGGMNKGNVHV